MPPPMSKNFASTGLGSSYGARVGSADRFTTAETREAPEGLGRSAESYFPPREGLETKRRRKSALRLCKVVVENVNWGGGTECRRKAVIQVIT